MMRIAADLIARRKPTDCSENLRLNGTLGRHLPEVSRRRTAAIPPSLLETRHYATVPSRCLSNFVCRWRPSPTWTNVIPVVTRPQTQTNTRRPEERQVGQAG